MVLAVVGLCIACGADFDEAAELGNDAGGLEVEKFGVAAAGSARRLFATWLTTIVPRSRRSSTAKSWSLKSTRRGAGTVLKMIFTNGCFDLLHPGHVRAAARGGRIWEIISSSD